MLDVFSSASEQCNASRTGALRLVTTAAARLGPQPAHQGTHRSKTDTKGRVYQSQSACVCLLYVGQHLDVTLGDALMHTHYTVLQAQLAGTSISRQWPKAGALNSRVAKFQNLDGDDFRQENAGHAASAAVFVDGHSLVSWILTGTR